MVSTTSSNHFILPRYDFTSSIAASKGSLEDSTNDLVTVSICSSAGTNSKPVVSMAFNQTNKSSIYPNPVNDILNISFDKKLFTSKVQLSIIDVNGTVVTDRVTNGADMSSINVSTLKPGLYTLRISDGTNEEKLKFVKH